MILKAVLLIHFLSVLATSDGSEFDSRSFGCTHTKNASVSYLNNVNVLFSDFTSQSSYKFYYNTSSGDQPDTVYGYYLCRGDTTAQLCHDCIINGTKFAQDSSCVYQDGIFYSDKCLFRYTNHSMYGVWDRWSIWVSGPHGEKVSNYKQYNQTLTSTIEGLINDAAFGNGSKKGFATTEVDSASDDEKIYGLAQCTPDIVGANCSSCLRLALSDLRSCCHGYQGAEVMSPNCQLRYDNRTFYDLAQVKHNSGSSNLKNLKNAYSILYLLLYFAFF